MTKWPLLEQAIHFQKTALDNAFSICSVMQHNGKDLLENSLNQYPWLPENGKQGYLAWARGCIQATDNLKVLIDRGFQEIETHLSDPAPAAQDTAEKKATSAPKRRGRAAAAGTAKKTVSGARTAASKPQSSTQAAKPTAEKQKSAGKETAADKQTRAENSASRAV